MYLKKLQLHGFKTFANKTDFFYDSGITAIVGPNGSGKSNIADAVRWVLGEQRYSMLRSKKTEDVIFVGSSGRPGMGFAEASITFDNVDRKIPLDFNEITITRRAYRSGDNEYYINKSRVRLKDIQEAVNAVSSNYTVITQGMVDAALSQKPDERRSLFEDAAAIGHYNQRREDAEDRLNKTQENMRRVSDLLSEIGPRMKGLEKNARQAQEYYALQEELQVMLRRWYGYRWRNLNHTLGEAKAKEAKAATNLEESRLNLESLKQQSADARARQNELRVEVAGLHRDSSKLHDRARQLQQQVAVDQEKINGLKRQRETQEQELINLRIQADETEKRLAGIESERQSLLVEQNNTRQKVVEQEAAQKSKAEVARNVDTQLSQKRDEEQRINSRINTLQHQETQLQKRRDELTRQQEQYYQSRNAALEKQKELEQEITVAQNSLRAIDNEIVAFNARRKSNEAENAAVTEDIRQHERRVQELLARANATRERLDLLSELQKSFAGLHSGVKAVMQQARRQKNSLNGILGLVSELVEVPAELEVAVEVALGGHLQDIVVESWPDAEEAIQFLRQNGLGRATFLPLDSLKANPGNLDQKLLYRSGVRGMAHNLVIFQEKYRVVYEQLLGRTLVVEDLEAARTILPGLPIGWNAVTLSGEIVRGGGAVTGGSSGKEKERAEGGVLMRTRELRELPIQLERLDQELSTVTTELTRYNSRQNALKQQTAENERENLRLNNQQRQLQEKINGLRGQIERLSHELKVREETHRSLSNETVALDEQEISLKNEREAAQLARQKTQTEIGELNKLVKKTQTGEQEEREKLTTLRTTAALNEQRLKSNETNLQFTRSEFNRLTGQISSRQEQVKTLEAQRVAFYSGLELTQRELSELSQKLETFRAEIEPLERELARLDREHAESEQRWNELSSGLLKLEGIYGRAALEVQRLEAELETLQVQATADLAPSLVAEQGSEISINPAEWVELLELSENEASQLQQRVENNRARLRRIGIINPLATQEYKEASLRYEFLTGQISDLEQATQQLRNLIKDLNQITQQKFTEAFARVAQEFSRYFQLLFNGGSAQLSLSDPTNPAQSGIEIVAQPPGKKLQNLALLSGGERALTAVALLFALLEVNPTPFCILDEVDAALDEANVKRFCETLISLAERTQFIVVTHNRGTIEAARTIYGISMGSDSVSRSISLRLDEITRFKQQSGGKASNNAKKAPVTAN